MKLHVLITCPAQSKLFADLAASACFVRTHHPDLTLDILVEKQAVPDWWKSPGSWLQVRHSVAECPGPYALIIQTTPEQELAKALVAIESENRAGVLYSPHLHVQGRWAQTLIAQIGSRRFAPFTPFDLFNHVLLGRTAMDFAERGANLKGQWIVDLDSLPNAARSWGESVVAQFSLTHPGLVADRLSSEMDPRDVACYVGTNAAAASWFSYHGCHVVLITLGPWEAVMAPAHSQAWIVQLNAMPTPTQLVAMLSMKETRFGHAYRHTTEFLGGQLPVYSSGKIDDSELVFDRLNYVVFNYLNDLLEVDLPIPEVTAACCLKLKGTQAVFGKLVHLNQFGIKFLQEFLDKVGSGAIKDQDMNDLSHKIGEIDQLTIKALQAYPEMDLLRSWSQFMKAGAQGENIIDIAKSLILIYHEMNQALQAFDELVGAVVRKHTEKQDIAGP